MRRTLLLVVGSVLALALACSEGESPAGGGGGGVDVTAPSLDSVYAQDNYHVTVVFSEKVEKLSAEYWGNYTITYPPPGISGEGGFSPAQNDTMDISALTLQSDGKSVLISVNLQLSAAVTYTIYVRNVKDLNGNAMAAVESMSFPGTSNQDVTAPSIAERDPAPGATGVGTGQSVMVRFDEPMDLASVLAAFYWDGPGGPVPYQASSGDGARYYFSPTRALEAGQNYTVGFTANTAMDLSGNYLPATNWSFTTTTTVDNTPPAIVSSSPADGETGVALEANFVVNFSEPVDQGSFDTNLIMVNPDLGQGLFFFSPDGRQFTFDPDSLLAPNTAYTVIFLLGFVKDLSGNATTQTYQIRFTTGSSMPTGSIAGTLSGDPNSADASDPKGTFVAAAVVPLSQTEGPPPSAGATEVTGSSGQYSIGMLADGIYYPLGVKDSNGDGILDPGMGDALGVFGIDVLGGDFDYDSVTVTGGAADTTANFPLYDQVAINGIVTYVGSTYQDELLMHSYYVEAFDTVGFDTTGGLPPFDAGRYSERIVVKADYVVNEFDEGLYDGTFYVHAFLDVNDNMQYDPGVDPDGWYAAGGNLEPVTVSAGRDAMGVDIDINDPGAPSPVRVSQAANQRSSRSRTFPGHLNLEAIRKVLSSAGPTR